MHIVSSTTTAGATDVAGALERAGARRGRSHRATSSGTAHLRARG